MARGRAGEAVWVTDQTARGAGLALTAKPKRLAVIYRGWIPKMFKAGGKVVVEGQRDQAACFKPTCC